MRQHPASLYSGRPSWTSSAGNTPSAEASFRTDWGYAPRSLFSRRYMVPGETFASLPRSLWLSPRRWRRPLSAGRYMLRLDHFAQSSSFFCLASLMAIPLLAGSPYMNEVQNDVEAPALIMPCMPIDAYFLTPRTQLLYTTTYGGHDAGS